VPISYRIDESIGLITLTASGHVTGADITDYVAASRGDPAFSPAMHRLVIGQGVEGFPQLPEVREITKRAPGGRTAPPPRIAAVADTPIGLGMISMFLGHWGLSDHYRVFDDVPSALTWLRS
jgi:hypothetical protein